MDTSKMRLLPKMSSVNSYKLLEIGHEIGRIAARLTELLEDTVLRQQLVEIVEELYDLGRVLEVYQIFGGYINRSFGLVAQRNGIRKDYFLRQYKHGIAEHEIKFEHSLINHCTARGFTLAARVIANRQGATYIKPANSKSFFAVYEFLEGEDKYTWDNPALNDEEFVSASKMLAAFHTAAMEFDPGKFQRAEPPIRDLLPIFSASFRKFAQIDNVSKFHRFFLGHLKNILESIDNTRIPGADVCHMPLCPIHCDFHPGNLKYENNRVVGIFDFDWSKIDLRLFDVCMAVAYFCCSWDEKNDGDLRLEKAALFLNAYQDQLHQTDAMKPLNAVEIKHLPGMLTAANLCIINWIVSTFYADDGLNDYEYLAYLKHSVRLLYSIEKHRNTISQIAADLLKQT
jgi:homoserine kinase type II